MVRFKLGRRQLLVAFYAMLALMIAITACTPSATSPAQPTAAAAQPAAPQPTAAAQGAAPAQPAQSSGPVASYKLGLLLPMTGRYSIYGVDVQKGIQFAVEEINKAGGIKSLGGAKIEMVLADTVADIKVALTEYERLVSKEKVDAIIGPFSSAEISQVAALSDKYQVPIMTIGGQGDDMYKLDLKWAVHMGPSGPTLGSALMNIVLDMVEEFKLPHDRIVFFAADTEATKWPIQASQQVAKDRGYGANIAGEVYAPADATDLTSYVLKLKSMKPDIFVGNNSSSYPQLIIRAMDAVEFYPAVWGDTTALLDPKTKQSVGDALYNKVVRRPGAIFYEYEHPDVMLKGVRDYKARVESFLKANNAVYTARVAYASQAVYVFQRALEQTASRDKAAINNAIHKMSIAETDPMFVSTPFGPTLEWKANGEPKNMRLLGLQAQLVGGKDVTSLVYPKALRPTGTNVTAK